MGIKYEWDKIIERVTPKEPKPKKELNEKIVLLLLTSLIDKIEFPKKKRRFK